ncbi:MAG: ABC transporter permease [Chloroflexota bacterium]
MDGPRFRALQRLARAFDLSEAVVALVWLAILLLVGIPLLTVLVATLRPGERLPFDPGPWTLTNFAEAFGSSLALQLLRNTVLYAVATLACALPVAFVLAWVVERTDLRLREAVSTLILIPLAIPPLLQAVGWALLLTPRNGLFNVWLRQAMGSRANTGPLNLYTFGGLVFVTVLSIIPSAFIMLSSMMRNANAQLEEAAASSGASAAQTLRRISLPLMLPAIVASLVYFGIVMIEFFELPLAIGQTAQFPVLSLQIFRYTQPQGGATPAYGTAAAFSLLGLVLGLVLLWGYRRATLASRKYAVVGGKGVAPRRLRLGWLKVPVWALVGGYLLLSVVLPLAGLVWASLLSVYQPPSIAALAKLTAANYQAVVTDSTIAGAVFNTVLMVVAAATITMLLAALVAWRVQRAPTKTTGLLDFVVFLPIVVPGIVIALAVLLVYIRTPLWGTIWILVVGQLVRFLPFTTRQMNTAILQINNELEEAGWASGASRLTTFRRVMLPLLAPALGNGWIWVAMHSVRDFTFPIMLATVGNAVVASTLWVLWQQGDYGHVSALAVVVVLASMLLAHSARRVVTRATI